jgi:hypothetical protein
MLKTSADREHQTTACYITIGAGGKCHRKYTAPHLWCYMGSKESTCMYYINVLHRIGRSEIYDLITSDLMQ